MTALCLLDTDVLCIVVSLYLIIWLLLQLMLFIFYA